MTTNNPLSSGVFTNYVVYPNTPGVYWETTGGVAGNTYSYSPGSPVYVRYDSIGQDNIQNVAVKKIEPPPPKIDDALENLKEILSRGNLIETFEAIAESGHIPPENLDRKEDIKLLERARVIKRRRDGELVLTQDGHTFWSLWSRIKL